MVVNKKTVYLKYGVVFVYMYSASVNMWCGDAFVGIKSCDTFVGPHVWLHITRKISEG